MKLSEAKTLSSSKRYSRWVKEAAKEINDSRDELRRDEPLRKIKLDYDDVDEAVKDLTEELGEVERWDGSKQTEWYWSLGPRLNESMTAYIFQRKLVTKDWEEKVAFLTVFDTNRYDVP